MSSGSKGIPGVWKARTGKKWFETMMTELDKLKEFAICSVDELRDEEIRMAERPRRFAFVKTSTYRFVSFREESFNFMECILHLRPDQSVKDYL